MLPEDAADDTVVALPDAKGSGGASPPLRDPMQVLIAVSDAPEPPAYYESCR